MGVIRKGLLVIFSVTFFLLLLSANTFLSLSYSLEYSTLKPALSELIEKSVVTKSGLSNTLYEKYPLIKAYCMTKSDFVINQEGFVVTIPCDVVNKGPDEIIKYGIESLIDDAYYKDYNCDFWQCFQEVNPPLFLVSEKAKDYWTEKFYYILGILLIVFAVMFFLTENKSNLPILAGVIIIFSGIPFMKINLIFEYLSGLVSESFLQIVPFASAVEISAVLFSGAYSVFLKSLLIGIIFIAIGIVIKIFKEGFRINAFIESVRNSLRKNPGTTNTETVNLQNSQSKTT